jgi:hypothetical protein
MRRLTPGRARVVVAVVGVALASLFTVLAVYALRTNAPTPFWERAWWYSWTAGVWLWVIASSVRDEYRARRRRTHSQDDTGE